MSRDLPMPASPEISTTRPSPLFARDQRRNSSSVSSSRPTRAVRPLGCSASKRLSTVLARSATQARTGSAMPLRSLAPRSLSSKRLPRSLRVASAMTTVFGSAISCRRAARFGVSPTMPQFLSIARFNQIADNGQPRGNANTGLQRSGRLECDHRSDHLQPRAHCSIGVILMGLGVAKVDEHAVAEIPRHEPPETSYGFSDALLIGRDDLAQVLRVHPGRERRRPNKVREHHRDLTTLRGGLARWL